jgi:prenyltransferase/squalene oxidase-like repeat protein
VGLKLFATLATATALATTPTAYLQSQQQSDGGWGSPQLTAWSVLALRAAGADTGGAVDYLTGHESQLSTPTELALVACAEAAAGHDASALLARLPAKPKAVNDAIWEIFALRQSHRPVPKSLTAYVKGAQSRSGGFPWTKGTAPDSNTTAWAVQALAATGVHGAPITNALAYLRKLQASNGGFRLQAGHAPDAQSTALAIQAFVAAKVRVPAKAFAFLASLRRTDGSYRYSRAYATTPVWVTAQVVPALMRKPLPLR